VAHVRCQLRIRENQFGSVGPNSATQAVPTAPADMDRPLSIPTSKSAAATW